tara:strand:- start:1349 stop:1894 length:546 start_codon:yes stop_codon:yes gene_type:complete
MNYLLYMLNRKQGMIKSLNIKMLLVFALGIFIISLQTPSIAVESDDDVIVITVDSTNLQFSPSEVTISEGQTVRFFWSGEFLEHNAVDQGGLFSTGDPETEVDYSFTFDKGTNNTYDFICEPHELLNMVGIIIVEPAEEELNSTYSIETKEETFPQKINKIMPLPVIFAIIMVILYYRFDR